MQNVLLDLAKDNPVHLVSIKNSNEIANVFGEDLLNQVEAVFCSSGNYGFNAKSTICYKSSATPFEVFKYAMNIVNKSKYENKSSMFMNEKESLIVISVPGFNLSDDEILAYSEWDKLVNERINIIKKFNDKFGETHTAYLEKSHEIVITSNSDNKSRILDYIYKKNDKITFFGSGMPNHSDYKLFKRVQSIGGKSIHVNDWRNTIVKI
jgi:hypothetical protein